ncbi:MAG: aminotransferase class III-fold pyridoxal phosphate-dependent enzyme, partial [Pelagibacteraceae bacterium]|nr:aminotransferase class III-fold pyridoxal phosphate-dependent enzyme [Pelagibacteraceae bacterium]
QSEYPKIVKEIRGAGLLVGLEISKDQTEFIKKLSDNKLLTVKASENVVRLLPPLTVKKQNIDEAVTILKKVCKTYK